MSVAEATTETFIPVQHAAVRIGVPIAWLRAEAEAGRVPALRAGRRILVNPAEVERVLNGAVTEEKRRHTESLAKLERAHLDASNAFVTAVRGNEAATQQLAELRTAGTPRLFDAPPPPPEPEPTSEPAADGQAPRPMPFNAAPVTLSAVSLTGCPVTGANLQAQA